MYVLVFLCFLPIIAWLYLALGHGWFWRPLLDSIDVTPLNLPSVTVIVPARDEAATLPLTLPSLLKQDYKGEWNIIMVDDHSRDGTAAIAQQIAEKSNQSARMNLMSAPELAAGWCGKVSAMNAGVCNSKSDYILFTDADIRHSPQSLRLLVARAEARRLDMVSRMVRLNCQSFAEKLLIPAFVFFFAMLYPFRRANDRYSKVAAAAGGTMLVRRERLATIGGMEAIKGALIDDCSLARVIKDSGGAIELTMTNSILSLRPYPHLRDVWHMVARTAYTQLRYNPFLLIATIIGMLMLYVLPLLLFVVAPTFWASLAGFICWGLMAGLYTPMVRFYGLPMAWAVTLPVAGIIYMAATVDSARRYYLGKGGQWKDRAQA